MKTKITTLSKQFSIPGALYFHNLIWLIRIKNDLRHTEIDSPQFSNFWQKVSVSKTIYTL